MDISDKGLLVVISGPSGSGKGTVVNELLARSDSYSLSISCTTREPRPGEIDGVSYYFVTKGEFEDLIDNGMMLEYTDYCGNYYGTPKKNVYELLESGMNVILEIEVEGALNIKKIYPEAVLILLIPPDFKTLEGRLRSRGTNSEESIRTRLEKARVELTNFNAYDYVVINKDDMLDETTLTIMSITDAEKFKTSRNSTLPELFFG